MSDDASRPIPVPGSAGVRARPFIRCTAAGACGVLDLEQVEAAAEAGLCCRVWQARTARLDPEPVPAADWPPFHPADDDAPGGGW